MANRKRKRPVDEFSLHEALDRTAAAGRIVEGMLWQHRGVKAVPKAVKKIDRALELLAEAYQEIGRVRFADAGEAPPAKQSKRGK